MPFRKVLLAFGLSIATFSTVSNAALVKSDWKSVGDNQVVLHEEAGLEFLSLDNTAGISASQFNANNGEGQMYEGFRIAGQGVYRKLY